MYGQKFSHIFCAVFFASLHVYFVHKNQSNLSKGLVSILQIHDILTQQHLLTSLSYCMYIYLYFGFLPPYHNLSYQIVLPWIYLVGSTLLFRVYNLNSLLILRMQGDFGLIIQSLIIQCAFCVGRFCILNFIQFSSNH